MKRETDRWNEEERRGEGWGARRQTDYKNGYSS
jgi:hypothetical protein